MGKTTMRVAFALFGFIVLIAATTLFADELQDLSSADVAPPAVSEPTKKADLGEGTGQFSGALMTSGSFTMMAAGGGLNEELGEGTGQFSCALMTSGSFTMMAAGAGVQEELGEGTGQFSGALMTSGS